MTLYSTGCPQCNVLEKKLKSKNINFTIVSDVKMLQKKGFISAPYLEHDDGTLMNFKEAIEWIAEI